MKSPESLQEQIDSLIGCPFEEFGRGPDSFDCLGVVRHVGSLFNVDIPDYESVFPQSERERKALARALGDADRVETPQPGDVIYFRQEEGGIHMGIVVDSEYFVHATRKFGVCKTRLSHPMWSQLIQGFYRARKA
ncbi:MAG: C40 family peptidase [Desulfobacteraceae bacterium]|nr:C40 family peptidase [Desulfobacteraceae bacterium]